MQTVEAARADDDALTPPALKEGQSDWPFFKKFLGLFPLSTSLLVVGMALTLLVQSYVVFRELGHLFLVGTEWDPVYGSYGALPFLAGTLLTSVLALLFSLPLSMAMAILLGEYLRSGLFSSFLQGVLELLAGIPSIVYGFWGLMVLVPFVRFLQETVGAPTFGVSVMAASLLLAVMVTPYAASVGAEVLRLVPQDLKEAAYALGATRLEVLLGVSLPYARSGLFAGVMLSFGRALGETMAVTMVIGNANRLPTSVWEPASTMASVIANEFAEAVEEMHLLSLVALGFLLMVVTVAISLASKWIIHHLAGGEGR